MMDCEEDDRDPWEREEEEAVAMCEAQAVAEMEAFGMCEEPPPNPHEPTAVPGEESGSPVQLPLSAPDPPEPHSRVCSYVCVLIVLIVHVQRAQSPPPCI